MRKIPSQQIGRPLLSLRSRWPQGWESLVKDAKDLGFEPWVPRHSRLFADWNLENFALCAASNGYAGDEVAQKFTFVAGDSKLARAEIANLCAKFSFVALDAKHPLASEFKSDKDSALTKSLVVVNAADGFIDWLTRETWSDEWVAAKGELISPKAKISASAHLEHGVLVGPDAVIGDDVIIGAGARIGARVHIGRGSFVGAYTVIADGVHLGEAVQLGPHCNIGGAGFGIIKYPKSPAPFRRMHLASVRVGDRVVFGAFVNVDRGVFEDSTIGNDTQIDSHVHIAHNCHLGESNVLCAFVGFAGSTNVGSRSTFAAMVGSKGHIDIGDDVVVAAQSGISRDLKNGEQVKGYPVRALPEALKIAALTSRLPELYDRIKKLEKSSKGSES